MRQCECALAASRISEAENLLGRARSLFPDHPAVLNAGGILELRRGQLEAARALFEQGCAKDPRNPAFLINLASTLRRLNLPDAEMQALERVLALEPRHLLALLQKGSLFERTGKKQQAAETYHNALQTIPHQPQLPESLRAPVAHAAHVVQERNRALESLLRQQLCAHLERNRASDLSRFEHCVDALLGKRRIYEPRPTLLHFPKLPNYEFHPRAHFPWLEEVEAASQHICAEFERVLKEDADGLEPYIAYPEGAPLDQWKDLNHSRRWSVFYLWRDGRRVEEHLARCPRTAALLERIPHVDIPEVGPSAFFSILDARSHIPPHTGVTNTRVIVHVPLIIPGGCRFRVGSETREWRSGEAWVFDDTLEHEAWNNSDAPRAILIFDVWNPHLTAAERDLVRAAVAIIHRFNAGGRSSLSESV